MFADSQTVLVSAEPPGPGVRAREPMDGKFLPSRNQTLLISDQFLWPLNGRMSDVAFLSGVGDEGARGMLCLADVAGSATHPGDLAIKTVLAQVTLLQDDTGAIKHVMLARRNAHNKGYGPVVYALKSDLNA